MYLRARSINVIIKMLKDVYVESRTKSIEVIVFLKCTFYMADGVGQC